MKPGGTRSYAATGVPGATHKTESPKDGDLEKEEEILTKVIAQTPATPVKVLKKDQVNKANEE